MSDAARKPEQASPEHVQDLPTPSPDDAQVRGGAYEFFTPVIDPISTTPPPTTSPTLTKPYVPPTKTF